MVGRDSSVGIVTRYVLEGPGSKPDWGEIFLARSDRPCGNTQSPIQWVPGLSSVYGGRDLALTTHSHLAPRLEKE